jgi:hypothetical protein
VARINPPVSEPWTSKLLNLFLTKRFGKPFPSVKLLGHHPRYPFAYGVLSSTFGLAKTKLLQTIKRLAT